MTRGRALVAALAALLAAGCSDRPAAVAGVPARVQAEDCATTGAVSEAGTRVNTPQSEASGRRFTTLPPGASLDLVSPIAADSIVLRVSLPDAPQGGGGDGALELRIGDATHALPITSRCTLVYGHGRFNTADVWPEDPAQGDPRHFWDESAMRLPAFPAGARVTVRNPDPARSVLVDFAEFELLPPAAPVPEGALVFAPPAGGGDCTAALQQAIDAAAGQRRALYLAEGDYRVGVLQVPGIRLQGAGMWRSRLLGPLSRLHLTGGTAQVADLAIHGETSRRNDRSDDDNAVSGVPGPGSRLERLWVERKKCAYWHAPLQGRSAEDLLIRGWRIRDTYADGINLYIGARRCVIEDCDVRNTGDDGLAVWSPAARGAPSGDIAIRNNRVELPWFANAIALYGGGPFTVVGNHVADTVTTGSGIYVSASFKAHPFAGTVQVADNTLLRCGAHESGQGGPTGALRLLALDEDMTAAAFVFAGNTVVAPLESALSLQGPRRLTGVTVSGLVVQDLGSAVVADVRPGAQGEALIVDAVAPAQAPWRVADDAAMTLLRRTGADTVRVLPALPRIDRSVPAGDPATRAPDWTLQGGDAIVDLRAPDAAGVPQRWGGPQDLSARIWLAHDAGSLRIRAVVQDDVQHQDGDADGAWRGDGLQIALTVPGRPGRLEFGIALHDDGRVLRSLWAVPPGAAIAADAIAATVRRSGTETVYEVALPRAAAGLDDAVLDRGFRFNMIVNDNDGSLRKSFARIAPGIGESKNPATFPVIRLE